MVYIYVRSSLNGSFHNTTYKEDDVGKSGTLFLYDSENMKVPVKEQNNYEVPRVNIEKLTELLKHRFMDTHNHFISFGKRYYGEDNKRNQPIDRYNKRLEKLQYTIIEKNARVKSNTVTSNGERMTYQYEDCDMDANIIHVIHTIGKDYSRVVLISGDSDMKQALEYIRDEYSVEIWVVSHKENLSHEYNNNNVITIGELFKQETKNDNA